MSINRGDIFYVNPSETVGSEQRSGRPAIIVSNPPVSYTHLTLPTKRIV